MKFSAVIPVLAAFMISALSGPVVIPYLRRLKIGQTVRDDGPATHLKKSGTPTMGGVIFLVAIIIVSLFYIKDYPHILPILFAMIGFGAIGFADDYIKVVLKRSLGLKAWQKMALQILVCGALLIFISRSTDWSFQMILPFTGGKIIDLGIFTIPALFVVVLGTVNGANFTDGIDGLATTVTTVIAGFFTVIAMMLGNGIEPITGAVAGALLGFLLFNVYPAKVFMGDTGSLALGGFVAASAISMKMPIFIIIIAFIYLLEVCSVIIQVSYFKMSGGKRVFKMAPIHHHFEMCGWSEAKVVAVFSIITFILCLIGILAI